MVGLREIPNCKINKLDNGYSEVKFQIADEIIDQFASKPHTHNCEEYRSIFVEFNRNK